MSCKQILATIGVVLCTIGSVLAQMTLMVDAYPPETPSGDTLYIAGDFQGWNPGSPAHQLTYDSTWDRYHITLDSGLGTIQFKFTRGSWATVESDENGSYIPDRSLATVDGDTALLEILGWEDLTSGGGSGNSTAAENVHIITDSFYLSSLNRYRRIWIYLPKGYDSSSQDYPVLYMHDGQNVFDAYTSFAGEWEVDETLNARYDEHGDEGIIVVAIDNGGAFRTEEYSPWENATYGGGRGDDYLQSLVEDVKPYIDANYRTLPGREHTGIMGSSLGGLISTYAALRYDSIFSKIGSLSPAYWFNPELFDYLSSWEKAWDSKVYQIAGSQEGSAFVDAMFEMEDSLKAAGFSDSEVRTIEHADGAHSEWYWAREFEAAYLWLFKDEALGMNTPDGAPHATLFPNPSSHAPSLRIHLTRVSSVGVQVLTVSGQSMAHTSWDGLPTGVHTFSLPIDAQRLQAGAYVVSINVDGKVTHHRWVHLPK